MEIHNVLSDAKIRLLMAFIQYDKEQIKSRHDGGRHGNILLDKLKQTLSESFLSYLPWIGFAAAKILVRAFKVAWIPALVILIVCCSMAS